MDLECPVVGRLQVANEFGGLRVPAKGSVVLSAGQQEVGILTAPIERQNTLVMTSEDLCERQSFSALILSTGGRTRVSTGPFQELLHFANPKT